MVSHILYTALTRATAQRFSLPQRANFGKPWPLQRGPWGHVSDSAVPALVRGRHNNADQATTGAEGRPSQTPLPLEGIRILDLSRVLAGPYCTMLLGDLGAEVIKVEQPGRGDDTRSYGPPFLKRDDSLSTAGGSLASTAAGESAYFLCVNRNKKSVALDFKTAAGRALLCRMAQECDVFVENYVPGKLAALGLGYQDLRQLNPGLIYTSISGPYAQRAGYDVMVEAEGGLMYITGERDGTPVKVGVAITDLSTGLYAHGAIMAALISRGRTGRGQHLDISLLDCQLASLANIASSYLTAGIEAQRWGTSHPSIVPYRAFPTADGSIVVGGGNDRQFRVLCEHLGLPDLLNDPRYRSNRDRVQHRDTLEAAIGQRLRIQPTAHWLAVLSESGIPFAPVNNLEQTFKHPQVSAREIVQTVDHPVAGPVRLVGPAVKYSDTPATIRLPPPTLGQHTAEVLCELLALDPKEVERLRGDKVIA
ncbi:hypothetical protein IWQ60_010610 [Tieghemiomyces parasiticus]|uniref:Uncharacterized protein n=1 Tax=Tieghemiomyces parasiticus TaxID=78921 RepID=A0A9W7ZU25_9FUNG|nr:hypothetical protein IWQ60_010610 [Tieghemiomyces parasiticus]